MAAFGRSKNDSLGRSLFERKNRRQRRFRLVQGRIPFHWSMVA